MAEFRLMASPTSFRGLFHNEQGLNRELKEFQPFMPTPETRPLMIRSGCFHTKLLQLEDPWISTTRLSVQTKLDSTIKQPELVDIQETRMDSVLLSLGIAEQCRRHGNILQFLMSPPSEGVINGQGISLKSSSLQTLAVDMHPQTYASLDDGLCLDEAEPPFIYPNGDSAQKFILDFVGDLIRGSKVAIQSDGKVLLAGSAVEMKDLLSVVAELYLSKSETKCRRQQLLVPHFSRVGWSDRSIITRGSHLELDTMTAAPLKSIPSPQRNKQKSSPRKRCNKKTVRVRDLYRKNYFHACENLLTLLLEKRRGKTAILSINKWGPEPPEIEILNQFSAGIAGTGIAVVFSVACKFIDGRAPLCAPVLLNTGVGVGLVWLSWSVNRLRETIIYISKNSSKLGAEEDELMSRLDRSMKEIFFRAATILAVTVLSFA